MSDALLLHIAASWGNGARVSRAASFRARRKALITCREIRADPYAQSFIFVTGYPDRARPQAARHTPRQHDGSSRHAAP